MLNRKSLGFIRRIVSAYPYQSVVMIVLLMLAGMAEGIGLLTLLPLVELTTSETEPSGVARMIGDALRAVGVEPSLGILLLVVVGGLLLKGGFHVLAMRHVGRTVAAVATDLRLALISALMTARWGYFVNQPVGRFSNAIATEALRAANAYRSVCSLAATIIQVAIYGTVALLVSWEITLLAIAGGLVLVLVLSRLVEVARNAGGMQTDLLRSLVTRLTDSLHGLKPIKAMGRENLVRPLLESETEGLNRAQANQVVAFEGLKAAQEPLIAMMIAGGLFLALGVAQQPLPTVLVMAFLGYRLMGRLSAAQSLYQDMAVGESAYESLRESIQSAERQVEPLAGGRQPTLDRDIVIDDVRFSYGTSPVLKGASAVIEAGTFVAITGPSGAGKTSLADLVVGLYEPQRGAIRVDGIPLFELDIRAWRRMIGYVPQETLLFHDTLLRNVTLGDDSLAPGAVERALRDAGAREMVEALPEGLDTVLGERGSRLSGGQRQRIAIARALVHEPKLLVLDEITSALDAATAGAIGATLRELAGSVTIVAITHQSVIVDAADTTYMLEDGVLIPQPCADVVGMSR